MGRFLFIALVAVPIIEIGVFIQVGGAIGLWSTLAIVVLTALAGTILLRRQGLATLQRAQQKLSSEELPVAELFDGACILFAGALLLTPGFVTDAVGLLLMVPPVRSVIGHHLWRLLREHVVVNGVQGGGPGPGGRPGGGDGVIDGDFEDVTPGGQRPTDPPERRLP